MTKENILKNIKQLINTAQSHINKQVDYSMTLTNFIIGWYIVEDEQAGEKRAGYAKETIAFLSKELTKDFGKGYSARNLALMKKFYITYAQRIESNSILQTLSAKSGKIGSFSNLRQILQTVSAKSSSGKTMQELPFTLSWSHYVFLSSVSDKKERSFYEIEATNENWSISELKRQFNSSLYERLALSRDKEGVKELSRKGQIITQPKDNIKNPYVLEFLGIDERSNYTENDLETAIINKIEQFLLELGKGFLFEARQKRFTYDEDHYFVDLVFYNRLLRCYTIIDLKIGELTHQDLGQMQMYVNYYDRYVKLDEEKPTIGIIICKKQKESLVEITLPKDANIHASEYKLYLPSKEELKEQLAAAERSWEEAHE